MTTPFGKHIISLLKEHECVVLPEVGALLLKNSAAHIAAGQIFAASKKIVFNKNIYADDNLLSAALVNEGLSYIEAKTEVKSFINNLKFELIQNGFFDIDTLGRFIKNQQEISFVSSTQIENLDKQNFGFENLSIFPVHREIVREEKQKTAVLEKIISQSTPTKPITTVKTRSIRKSSLVGLAASFLLIIAISSLMFSNTNIDSLQVKNANVLDFLVPAESAIETKAGTLKRIDKTELETDQLTARKNFQQETTPIKEVEQKEKPEALHALSNNLKNLDKIAALETKKTEAPKASKKEILLEDVLHVKTDNPKGFYVIIGAFSDLSNANKAKYECSIENACSVFKTDNGMYRVGIYTSTEKTIAVDILKEYKKTNASYWLMENN